MWFLFVCLFVSKKAGSSVHGAEKLPRQRSLRRPELVHEAAVLCGGYGILQQKFCSCHAAGLAGAEL